MRKKKKMIKEMKKKKDYQGTGLKNKKRVRQKRVKKEKESKRGNG